MRMHEILGVRPNEVFSIPGFTDIEYRVDEAGRLNQTNVDSVEWNITTSVVAYEVAINKGIIHHPLLTDLELDRLYCISEVLGYHWMACDYNCDIFLYSGSPRKNRRTDTWELDEDSTASYIKVETDHFDSLVSWYDQEPLYIPDLLKKYGVEGVRHD